MKVKIINARQGFWYAALLGKEFEVTSAGYGELKGMEGIMHESPKNAVVVGPEQEFTGYGILRDDMEIVVKDITHEVRLSRHICIDNTFPIQYQHTQTVEHAGNEDSCWEYMRKQAKLADCGVGLLMNNGGYRVVDLQQERKELLEKAAPDMLNLLAEYKVALDIAPISQLRAGKVRLADLYERTVAILTQHNR